MPIQGKADDVDDVRFTAYLAIYMAMNDEQVSDLIYQCRKNNAETFSEPTGWLV